MYQVKIRIGDNYRIVEDELTFHEATLVSDHMFDHKSEVFIEEMTPPVTWAKYLIPWFEEYESFHMPYLPWPWATY
jgi:hypothetical protein